MDLSRIDLHDIQALIRYANGHLAHARFYLPTIGNADAARQWLRSADIATAAATRAPQTVLQIAFTHAGLEKLGMDAAILDQFPHEFRTGMHEKHRARRLGDVDHNSPARWRWGNDDAMPDLLVMLYAGAGGLAQADRTLRNATWTEAFGDAVTALDTDAMEPEEHFGFIDGTSQPALDWSRRPAQPVGKSRHYGNENALGEFLLGYRNEYNRYTVRPLVDAGRDHAELLPLAEDEPGQRDFGRNGTFLVFRDLEQHVADLNRFTQQQAGADAARARDIGSSMVGRIHPETPIEPPIAINIPHDDPAWVNPKGVTPVPSENLPISGVGPGMRDVWLNQFTYGKDLDGVACPHGAHVRRANPRTSDMPEGTRGLLARALRTLGFDRRHLHDDLVSSTRFHRLLRRGRKFTRPAPSDLDGQEKGLYFICLNANISRQFEFVQASWLENPKFDGLDHADPLLGSRKPLWRGGPTDGYTRPNAGGPNCHYANLPKFVTLRGGAYFFMPGLKALRFIAEA